MSLTTINRIFLIFVGAIPVLPRPTAEGPERFVLPLVLFGLLLTWLLFWPKAMQRGRAGLPLLACILGFAMTAFAGRYLITESFDESSMLISRVLFVLGTLVMTHWLATTEVEMKLVIRAFLYGFILSACLAIFVSVTGFQILEADSVKPGRYLGGLNKTTGIFRSFGEFGIMGSFAWAYLLVYRRDFQWPVWLFLSALVLMAMLVAQSRNVYLVVVLTTAVFVLFHYLEISAFFRVVIAAAAFMIPIVVEVSLPALQQTEIGRKLVGEKNSVFERNLNVRFDQFEEANELIAQDPVADLSGYPRQRWRDLMKRKHGDSVAPHNYFLSTFLFVGFVGGFVWIAGLFVLPLLKNLQGIQHGNELAQLVNLMMLGTVVGLSFYEGFFSLTVMIAISTSWYFAFGLETVSSKAASSQPTNREESISSLVQAGQEWSTG